MRVRLFGASTAARFAGMALWVSTAGLLGAVAVHRALAWAFAVGFVASLYSLGRASPIPRLLERRRERLAQQLSSARRISFRGYGPRPDLLVALLASGMLWLVPLSAGAYAVKHSSGVGAVIAFALLAACAVLVGHLVIGRPSATEWTLGEDGIRLPIVGFVPHAKIESVTVVDDVVSLRLVGGETVEVGPAEDDGELAAVLAPEAETQRRRA